MNENHPNTLPPSTSIESLHLFLEKVHLPSFRRNLRNLLFHYFRENHDKLMPNFELFMEDMEIFFEFLDELEEGMSE